MVRKGYFSELKAKKELQQIYGRDSIIKIAISQQGADFIVACCGELIKIVEIKEHHQSNYYPRPIEKKQIKRIINFAKTQRIPAEIWIYKYGGRGKPVIKTTKYLYQPK